MKTSNAAFENVCHSLYNASLFCFALTCLETKAVEAFIEQKKGGHADEVETSINLYLQPERVNMALAKKDYRERQARDYGGYQPGFFSRDVKDPAYSDSGLYGDPTLATAKKGEKALKIMTDEWLKIIKGFAKTPLAKP
jgi:creatinine amidohydrolase